MSTFYRDSIIQLVTTIARPLEQYRYEKNVPVANVPAELVSMWFDDCYHPDTDLFRSSFSKAESEELAKFNTYYAERVDDLPTDQGVRGLQASPEWQQIQERANELLTSLSWHAPTEPSMANYNADESRGT